MNEKTYIEQLVSSFEDENIKNWVYNLIFWYHQRSRRNRILYYIFTTASLVSVSMIPIFNILSEWETARVCTTILSSISIICAGVLAIYNLKDSWLRYRESLESLKLESMFYIENFGEYASLTPKEKKEKFIENVKNISCNENNQWLSSLDKDVPMHGQNIR